MKSLIRNIVKNPLFSGSVLMIIGGNATNFINYLFHLVMGRLLGPARYGELASLISLIGLIGIISASFGLVITRYVSSHNKEEVDGFIGWVNNKSLIISFTTVFLLSIFSPLIAHFLNIKSTLSVLITGSIFIFSIPLGFNRAVLQGLLKFRQVVISSLVENSFKITFAVLFVLAGWSVSGSLLSFTVGSFLGLLLTKWFISGHLSIIKNYAVDLKPIILYSLPILALTIAQTSFYSSDLILVKHFFAAHESGIYASLSTLGKIIIFGAGPISTVMFPIISKRAANGENYKRVLFYSILMTLALSLAILSVYLIFPRLIINILFGTLYLDGSYLLFEFGVFVALFTLSSLMINYYLSIGRVRASYLSLLAAVGQVIGISFFHGSIEEVIRVSLYISSLLLLGLIIYFFYGSKISFRYRSGI